MVKVVLILAGAAAIAMAELPTLHRKRQTGEFWAVLVLLLLSVGFGLLAISGPRYPSLFRILIDIVEPFGRMMVGQ